MPIFWGWICVVYAFLISMFILFEFIKENKEKIIMFIKNLTKREWIFLIIAIFFMALCCLLFFNRILKQSDQKECKYEYIPDKNLIPIINRKYDKEDVQIDGKNFIGCTFNDVELQWEGNNFAFGPKNLFTGRKGLSSSDLKIKRALEFIWIFYGLEEPGKRELLYREKK